MHKEEIFFEKMYTTNWKLIVLLVKAESKLNQEQIKTKLWP